MGNLSITAFVAALVGASLVSAAPAPRPSVTIPGFPVIDIPSSVDSRDAEPLPEEVIIPIPQEITRPLERRQTTITIPIPDIPIELDESLKDIPIPEELTITIPENWNIPENLLPTQKRQLTLTPKPDEPGVFCFNCIDNQRGCMNAGTLGAWMEEC